MTGERDLGRLIATMEPALHPDPHGYALALAGHPAPPGTFATVAEGEGLTLIAPAAVLSAAGIDPGPPFARITLTVFSSLQAVGLTAAIARTLGDRGISANVVAGLHHDHIFLPWDRRHDALGALRALSAEAKAAAPPAPSS